MGGRHEKEIVTIVWFIVPNEHRARGGFMPVIERNGKLRGNTYGIGYGRDMAEKLAKAMAEDEAAHYSGDWDVQVRKGETVGGGTSAADREIDEWAAGVSAKAAAERTQRKRSAGKQGIRPGGKRDV